MIKSAPVTVALPGAGGRMGKTLIAAIQADPGLKLAAAWDVSGSPAVGRDAGEGLGQPSGLLVGSDAGRAIRLASCVIDFTRPEATLEHLRIAAGAGVGMVIGTTGFSSAQKTEIDGLARKIPIVMAANFAVGVNVVFKLAEMAARTLGAEFDVEIIEAHHRHKVDAPSGTALRLGEIVAGALDRDLSGAAVYGREGITGERDRQAIAFHSIRGGDIVGEHTVLFAGEGERVEVTVRSQSRMTYALGALRAAKFLKGRQSGLYDMQDVLGLR